MPTTEKTGRESEVISADELTPDQNNANRGTPRGRKALKNSLRKLGAGRSILIDKNKTILAGNKTFEEAKKQGLPIRVIQTDGNELIAVQRTDLDVKDKKAQELAISDNRVAELDLAWNPDVLGATNADLTELFEKNELGLMFADPNTKGVNVTERIEMQQPPKMLWVLLGIPLNRFDAVQEYLAALEREADISVQSARNE